MAPCICRICGTTFDLMHILQGGDQLIEKLRICANIEINFEDRLPNYICLKCEKGLTFSYRLRKQSEAMEQKLRQQLRQSQRREYQRQPLSINSLVNGVNDIKAELEGFREDNCSMLVNSSGDDDQLVLSDDTKTEGSIAETRKQMAPKKINILRHKLIDPKQLNSEDIRKLVCGYKFNNVNRTIAKSEDVNYADLLPSKKDIETLSPAPVKAVIGLHRFLKRVSLENDEDEMAENNITQQDSFPENVLMSNNENAVTKEDDIEIIQECKEPVENVKTSPVKLDGNYVDEVQIFEECFEPCGEYVHAGQENLEANVIVQPGSEVDYIEDVENIAINTEYPIRKVYSSGNIGVIHIEQGEGISYVENVVDLPPSEDYSPDNDVTEFIECEGTLHSENGESMGENTWQLHFAVDEVQGVSADDSSDYNDSEADKSRGSEEVKDKLPENMQTTLLNLQNQGSLKVSIIYKCDTCGQTLKTQSNYRQHIKEHGRERFSCRQCNKWFATRYRLQRHERIHNKDPFLYACNICANHYRHPQNLKRHMRSAHNTKNYSPFQCGVCKEIFSRSDVLKNHMFKHIEGRNFICEPCSKSFKSMHSLIDHKKSHLPNVIGGQNSSKSSNITSASTDSSSSPQPSDSTGSQRTYYCSFCGKISKHHFAHKNHLRTHTQERPFPCKFCKKKFRTLASQKTHERIHTDERPYECNRCLLTFRQSAHLKTHQLIHDGIMPFVCGICHMAFNKKSNLKVHTRIHTGERPYKCAESDCGQQFAKLAQLKRHAAQAHARDVGVLDDDGEDDVQKDDDHVELMGEDEKGEVEVTSDEGILANGESSLGKSKRLRVDTLEEPYLDVSVGAEEIAIEYMLIGSDS